MRLRVRLAHSALLRLLDGDLLSYRAEWDRENGEGPHKEGFLEKTPPTAPPRLGGASPSVELRHCHPCEDCQSQPMLLYCWNVSIFSINLP